MLEKGNTEIKRQPRERGRKNVGEGNTVMWTDREKGGNKKIIQTYEVRKQQPRHSGSR
jgi:hypothetical protein